jgi:outer membrane protein assembly factor BamA
MRLLLLVLALSLPGSVWAQATAQTELPAGPAPRKFVGETVVAVEFRGPSGRFREQELGYLVEQKVGAPYDPRAVRRTLELLFRLGRFENVEARAVPRVGGVALILVLEPSPIIARVELPGIRSVLPSALRGAIGGAAGEPYVPGSEARMALAAERFYRSRGFLRAKVLGRVAEAVRTLGGWASLR